MPGLKPTGAVASKWSAASFAVVCLLTVFVGCRDSSGPTAPEPAANPASVTGESADLAGMPGGDASASAGETQAGVFFAAVKAGGSYGGKKVAICHLPPGNPANIQEICVSSAAVPAHEAHGDYFPLTFWPDSDGDGFGDSSAPAQSACVVPPGFVEDNTDCDDGDVAVNPDADEILCDSLDNNCNGAADDDVNADGDPVSFCDGDCDDDDETIYPGASEILCDSVDQNCNGAADDDVNADGDPVSFCDGDCDDDDADRYPGNPEVCDDNIDNDCDSEVDPVSICGGEPPVAVDDDFILTPVECVVATCPGGAGLDRTCVLNAPAGTITANDSDPDSASFDAMINGPITDAGWSCGGDNLCTTDANVNFGASSLTVNADGSFDLIYTTSQNFIFGGPGDIVVAEFLYFLEDPEGNSSGNARVMVPVHCP